MTKPTDKEQVGEASPADSPEVRVPHNVLTGTQATVEGYTGRMLVLIDPKHISAASKSLRNDAGVSVSSIGDQESVGMGVSSLAEGEAILFGDIGVAVINAAPDRLQSVSMAVSKNSELEAMEPERFIYATNDFDLSYLRGFRDAVNHLYDKLTDADGFVAGTASAPGVLNEAQFSWALQAMLVPGCAVSGKNVKVAVLDTGIDLLHPDFQGRTSLTTESFIAGETVQDGNGHGTHCAGIIGGPFQPRSLPRFGVSPNVDLLIGKVLSDSGRGTDSSMIAGIRWAIAQGAKIISMSLGSPVSSGSNYSYIFQQIAERALQGGTLIVAAAGNDSVRIKGKLEAVSHPANCPAIMAVASIDKDMRVADSSNAGLNSNGGKIDVSGPGVDIVSTWPGQQQYKRISGTSMATPNVAGIAALYAETYPGLEGYGLWARLVQQALPLSAPTRDVGAGLVQAPR